MNVSLLDQTGSVVGDLELADAVFAVEMNQPVVHQVMVAQQASRRQGTQSALTRSEVRGGGKKPWRQKGTGRARTGSTRGAQWRTGGIIFAPKPRSYRQSVNRKVRRLAMRCVLSDKVNSGGLKALEGITLEEPKTREVAAILNALGAERKTLIVLPAVDETVWRAARNLPNVQTLPVGSLNVLDLINADHLIATGDALKVLEEVYSA